jgi:hypothetical protein
VCLSFYTSLWFHHKWNWFDAALFQLRAFATLRPL